MHNRLLALGLSVLFVTGCANTSPSNEPLSLADNEAHLVGIWAMMPLRNGIANVVEYTADGRALLHPFNCAEPGAPEVEQSKYRVAEDGQTIHVSSPMDEFDLNVLEFNGRTMRLGLQVSGLDMTFAYLKVEKVAPLCMLYQLSALQAKATPYQPTDFVPAPLVPSHADVDRLIGKWANEDDEVQIEVRRGSDGNAFLYQSNSENWRNLYNAVHWVGDELHFQSYAYSENESLFRHPHHKAQHATIMRALPDRKIQLSFLIGEKRLDLVLKQVSN